MGLSKTDYVRGVQCPKMLWLDAHKPQFKIIPPEVQARLDEGNVFGDAAMGIFGEFVETTAREADGRLDYAAMLSKTAECLKTGVSVICEAAFSWYGNYCAADILRKDGDRYALYEVKNTSEVRKEFIMDVAFQSLLIEKCGVKLSGRYLILRADEENGEKDGANGYKIVDISEAVRLERKRADCNLWTLAKVKKQPDEPKIPLGEQCDKPYRCWYYEYCRGSACNEEKF